MRGLRPEGDLGVVPPLKSNFRSVARKADFKGGAGVEINAVANGYSLVGTTCGVEEGDSRRSRSRRCANCRRSGLLRNVGTD